MVGFSSSEQDLENLKKFSRLTTHRPFYSKTGAEYIVYKKLQRLLLILAEHNYHEKWRPQKYLDQTLHFDPDDEMSETRKQVISELCVMQINKSNVKCLELYLKQNKNCQLLYENQSKNYTKFHFTIDSICQQFKNPSANVLARFASITGNVSYLIRMISELLFKNDQSIQGNELSCQALFNSENQTHFNFIAKYDTFNEFPANKFIWFQNKAYVIDQQNLLIYEHSKDTLKWEQTKQFQINFPGPYLDLQFQQENICIIGQINTQKFWLETNCSNELQQLTDKIILLRVQTTKMIKIWRLQNQYVMTQVLENNTIQTTILQEPFICFEQEFPDQILDIKIIEHKAEAIIVSTKGNEEKLQSISLTTGNIVYSYQITDKNKPIAITRPTFQTEQKVQFEFPKCPLIDTQTFDVKHLFKWTLDGSDEIFQLSGTRVNSGPAWWNFVEEGSWSYSQNILTIKRGNKQTMLVQAETGHDLLVLPEKQIKLSIIMTDQTIGKQILLTADRLDKYKPVCDAQFKVGPNSGTDPRENPSTLISSVNHPWNKWYSGDCINGKSWITVTFDKQVTFCGLSVKTANDFPHRDPKEVSYFVSTPENKWVHIRTVQLNKTYQRYQPVLSFVGHQRTNAIMIYLQNDGKTTQLQISEVIIYQEVVKEQSIVYQNFKPKIQKTEFIICKEKSANWNELQTCDFVQSSQNIYAFENKNSLISEYQQELIEDQQKISEFYEIENPITSSNYQHVVSALSIIKSHSILQQNRSKINGQQNSYQDYAIKWLHLHPSRFYFESIETLMKKCTNSIVFQIISQNLKDNLSVALLRKIKVQKMFDYKEIALKVEEQIPGSLNYFFRHNSELSQVQQCNDELHSCLFKQPNYIKNIQVRRICEKVINGNLENFIPMFQHLFESQMFAELQTIVTCMYNINKKLPAQIEQMLCNQIKQEMPSQLRELLQWIFENKVIYRYLKVEDLKLSENYDEKGYKVLQSELLSGGVQSDEMNFFSTRTQETIQDCFQLTGLKQILPTKAENPKSIFTALIYQDEDQFVDELIEQFQSSLQFQNFGGEIGMKLVRAAFAVMIKLNKELSQSFIEIIDQIDIRNGDEIPQEKGPERSQAIQQVCQEQASFITLKNVWQNANKMRNWLMVKKSSINNKFTEVDEDLREIQEKNHLNEIYARILEKSEFLIKLEPTNLNLYEPLVRKASLGKQQKGNQAEQLQIKLEAQINSVLSCLQSPVSKTDIQNQVENAYKAAVKRYTGLYLLNQSQTQNFESIVNCLRALQLNQQGLSHFLDQIQGGCNQELENNIRNVIFEIIGKVCKSLASTNDLDQGYLLLHALQWQYQARDFGYLVQLDIFQTLSGKDPGLIQNNWGKLYSKNASFQKELVSTFFEIYLNVLARITDPTKSEQTRLKIHGDSNVSQIVPNLRKVKSLVNEDSSCILIESALKVIFRTFDMICNDYSKIEKIDNYYKKIIEESKDKCQALFQILNGEEIEVENEINTGIDLKINFKREKPIEIEQIYLTANEEFTKTLLQCVKLLTSISQSNKSAEKVLKRVYQNQSLLQILKIVSDKNKYLILTIFDDLIKLNLQIEAPETINICNNSLANYLFYIARESNSYQVIKMMVRQIRNLNPVINATNLEVKDRFLVLMIQNQQSELKAITIGDQMLNSSELLKVTSTSGNKITLYSQASNEQVIQYSHSFKFAPFLQKSQSIKLEEPSKIIKIMLLNIASKDQQVLQFAESVILEQTRKQMNWLHKQAPISFVVDELEAEITKNLFPIHKSTQKRNLVKKLHRIKIESDKYFYYTQIYSHLENSFIYKHLVNLHLQDKVKPSEQLTIQLIEQTTNQELDQLVLKINDCKLERKKINLTEIFRREFHHEQQRTKTFVVKEPSEDVLLLFKCYKYYFEHAEKLDLKMLWHLNYYYVQTKSYNNAKNLKKQNITSKWIKILLNQEPEIQDHYINKIIRKFSYLSRQLNKNIFQYELTIVCKLVCQTKTYIDKVVKVIILWINSLKVDSDNYHLPKGYTRNFKQIRTLLQFIYKFALMDEMKPMLQIHKELSEFIKVETRSKDFTYQITWVQLQIQQLLTSKQNKYQLWTDVLNDIHQLQKLKIYEGEPNFQFEYNQSISPGEWIQITDQTLCVKVPSFTFIAISNEKQIGKQTEYKTIDSELKLKQKSKFVMIGSKTPSIISTSNKKTKIIQCDFGASIFSVKLTHKENGAIYKFVSYEDGRCEIFTSQGGTEFHQHKSIPVTGLAGKVIKIQYYQKTRNFFIFTNQQLYRIDEKELWEQIEQKESNIKIHEKIIYCKVQSGLSRDLSKCGKTIYAVSHDNKQIVLDLTFQEEKLSIYHVTMEGEEPFEIQIQNGNGHIEDLNTSKLFLYRSSYEVLDVCKFDVLYVSYNLFFRIYDKFLYRSHKDDEGVELINIPENFSAYNELFYLGEDSFAVYLTLTNGEQVCWLLKKQEEDQRTKNRVGIEMKLGTGSGSKTFYCGRNLGRDQIPGSDGRCGPNSGPQCPDCVFPYTPIKFIKKICETKKFVQVCSKLDQMICIDRDGQLWQINAKGQMKLLKKWLPIGTKANNLRAIEVTRDIFKLVIETDSEPLFMQYYAKNKKWVIDFDQDFKDFVHKSLARPGLIEIHHSKSRKTNHEAVHYIDSTFISQYYLHSQDTVDKTWDFTDEEIASCLKFLNSELKKIKFKTLKNRLIIKKKRLQDILKPNLESQHKFELIQMLISANQFLLDNKHFVLAAAYDYRYTQMEKILKFIERFTMPYLYSILIYIVQKSQQLKQKESHQFSFKRINSEKSLFEQLYEQVKKNPYKIFTCGYGTRPFQVYFVGERAYDAGGPFRDLMEGVCKEITQYFLKADSNQTNYSPLNMKTIPDLKRFQVIGNMVGWALQSSQDSLSIDLNVIFWKKLLNLKITLEDLQEVDIYRYQVLKLVIACELKHFFTIDLEDGQQKELCEGGSLIEVTPQNCNEFIELYLQIYLDLDSYSSIIAGVKQVLTPQLLRMITPQLGPITAFQSPKIKAEQIIQQTNFADVDGQLVNFFKQMVKDFSNQERQQLLKFISGSSRLDSGSTLYLNRTNMNNQRYPVAHTCGKSVDIPQYKSYEQMKTKFKTAIQLCGEIDDDGGGFHDGESGEDDEGEEYSNHGEGEDDDEYEGEDEDEDEGETQNGEVSSSDGESKNDGEEEKDNEKDDNSILSVHQFYNDLNSYSDSEQESNQEGEDGQQSYYTRNSYDYGLDGENNGEGQGESNESDEDNEQESEESSDNGEAEIESNQNDSNLSRHTGDNLYTDYQVDNEHESEENQSNKLNDFAHEDRSNEDWEDVEDSDCSDN